MKLTPLNSVLLASGLLVASIGHAGMVKDSHGNVAYDTAAECDAAVQSGQARFYEPSTTMPALRRKGEATVRTARLSDLGPKYKLGACDVGVSRKNGRNGVAKALVGKYVPYSPDMPINLYADQSGMAVRANMAKCDNHFSDVMPRAVPLPVVLAPAPAPIAVAPAPAPAPAPVPAPVVAAPVATPVVVAAPPAARMTPYLFGTLGVVNDSVVHRDLNGAISVGDSDRQIGLQMGAGLQFNNILGAEVFYQAGKSHEYTALNGADLSAKAKVLGARVTAGSNVTEKFRLFGKLGVASVKHSSGQFADLPNHSSSQTRPTVGVGFTYALSESLMLRGDADHYPLRGSENPRWGNVDYFGLGLQYNF